MPVMDGFQSSQAIRQMVSDQQLRGPRYPSVVALTAYATDTFKDKCLENGMEQVLTKPISSAKLGQLLKAKGLA